MLNKTLLPKLYVVGGSIGYAGYLRAMEGRSVQFELTQNPAHADMALFTGGEDVNPATYGEGCGSWTHFTNRDKHEVEMFNFFVDSEVPMVGICRGLQLFAGLNGGRLIQDTTGHAGANHGVVFEGYDDEGMEDRFKGTICLPYTSAHHQMVDPTKIKPDWKILGISDGRRSKHYLGGDDKPIHGVDTE